MIVTICAPILSEVTPVHVGLAFSSTPLTRKPAQVRFYCFAFTFMIISCTAYCRRQEGVVEGHYLVWFHCSIVFQIHVLKGHYLVWFHCSIVFQIHVLKGHYLVWFHCSIVFQIDVLKGHYLVWFHCSIVFQIDVLKGHYLVWFHCSIVHEIVFKWTFLCLFSYSIVLIIDVLKHIT